MKFIIKLYFQIKGQGCEGIVYKSQNLFVSKMWIPSLLKYLWSDCIMKILLARKDLNAKPKSIDTDVMEKELESCDKVYYFDKKNTHKEMMSLVEHFENIG
jgi:hypothetical protein